MWCCCDPPEGFGMSNVHNHEYNQANWLAFYYGHRKRCRWHTCAVRAHQQDRHMVQINHLFFMGGAAVGMQLPCLWMARQLLQGVLERDELPQRRAVCGSSAKDFITAVWEYSGRWCWERRWAVLTESNAVFILTGTL